jgi:hypothetical protein
VGLLLHHDYDSLPLRERVAALRWLSDQVLEGPSIRAELEERDREAQHLRKQLWEEAKVGEVGGVLSWERKGQGGGVLPWQGAWDVWLPVVSDRLGP